VRLEREREGGEGGTEHGKTLVMGFPFQKTY